MALADGSNSFIKSSFVLGQWKFISSLKWARLAGWIKRKNLSNISLIFFMGSREKSSNPSRRDELISSLALLEWILAGD